MEVFSSLLGEEIANTYAKVFKASSDANDRLVSTGHNPVAASPSRPTSADDAKSVRSDDSPVAAAPATPLAMEESPEPPPRVQLAITAGPLKPLQVPDKTRSPSQQASLDKLQECLRRNVERYMHESLNTMNISRCVRELLSVHNIGQRLFAKFVLGLSQGTVSELLSKPKPWDKLTEKGRDSYRKMHAWAADETCIYILKSLVPRKGKNGP